MDYVTDDILDYEIDNTSKVERGRDKKYNDNELKNQTTDCNDMNEDDNDDDGIRVIINPNIMETVKTRIMKREKIFSKKQPGSTTVEHIDASLKPIEMISATKVSPVESPVAMAMLTVKKKPRKNQKIEEMRDELQRLRSIMVGDQHSRRPPVSLSNRDRKYDRVFSCGRCLWEMKHKCFGAQQNVTMVVSDNRRVYSCNNCSFSVVHGVHVGMEREIGDGSGVNIVEKRFQCCGMCYTHRCSDTLKTCCLVDSFGDDVEDERYRITANEFKSKAIKCEECSTFVYHDDKKCGEYRNDKIIGTPVKTMLSWKKHHPSFNNGYRTWAPSCTTSTTIPQSSCIREEGECSDDEAANRSCNANSKTQLKRPNTSDRTGISVPSTVRRTRRGQRSRGRTVSVARDEQSRQPMIDRNQLVVLLNELIPRFVDGTTATRTTGSNWSNGRSEILF